MVEYKIMHTVAEPAPTDQIIQAITTVIPRALTVCHQAAV
jgi:hypothetical protein